MKKSDQKWDDVVGSPVRHYFILLAMLIIVWLLLTGTLDSSFLIKGVLSCIVIAYLCLPMTHVKGRDGKGRYFIFDINYPKFIIYNIWLLKEIIVSNISVAKALIHKEMKIDPGIIYFRMQMENPIANVILANSITLTPGTVTLEVTEDGVYTIHALTRDAADGLLDGGMQRRVARLFKEPEELEIIDAYLPGVLWSSRYDSPYNAVYTEVPNGQENGDDALNKVELSKREGEDS